MAKTLLEKMFLKPEYAVAIINLPAELKVDLQTKQKSETSLHGAYNFILAFYTKEDELKESAKLEKALLPGGLLWIAYPKNKAMETDLNRDILHELMKKYGFDGVSIVSINTTWSAMRFKAIKK